MQLCRQGLVSRSLVTRNCRWFSSTVDSEEIRKFSKVGNDWWNPSSGKGTGPLHAMNPIRVAYVRQSIAVEIGTHTKHPNEQIRGLKILDAGCGGGLLSEALARLGAEVVGIDPSEENIAVAKQHSQLDPATANIRYIQTTIEQLAETGEKFDAVCSLEVRDAAHLDSLPF